MPVPTPDPAEADTIWHRGLRDDADIDTQLEVRIFKVAPLRSLLCVSILPLLFVNLQPAIARVCSNLGPEYIFRGIGLCAIRFGRAHVSSNHSGNVKQSLCCPFNTQSAITFASPAADWAGGQLLRCASGVSSVM